MDSARTPAQLGQILQRHRRQDERSQSVLGEAAGLRQATISNIEAGAPATRIGSVFDLLAAMDLEMRIVPRTRTSETNLDDLFR